MSEKTTKKKEQHIVPRTYLKYFRISDQENFVYCIDSSDQYKKMVQRVGLNHSIFKKTKYYNDNKLENPYGIEDFFGEDIEPIYDKIMDAVATESDLSVEIRSNIILWLYVTKMRSSYMRDSMEDVILFSVKTIEHLKNGKENAENKSEEIEAYSRDLAKRIHLSSFADADSRKKLYDHQLETLMGKHWKVLKAPTFFPFWTNDNPGFSPNVNPMFAKQTPFHHVMEMNNRSIIYFVLSPTYCLEFTPPNPDNPRDICAYDLQIRTEEVDPRIVDYINYGVHYSRHSLIISNKREYLEKCIIFK